MRRFLPSGPLPESVETVSLHDVLCYTLGCDVPSGFVDRLVQQHHAWDEVFRRRLEDMACELRPDLIVWEIVVDRDGALHETRIGPRLPPAF